MSDCLVIIPTYNEKENIQAMIQTVMELPLQTDLLIIDDGSPDGTADLVRQAQTTYKNRLHLVTRTGKLGLGTAYIRGFEWGIERHYQYIFEMDCDFSHPPQKLMELHQSCLNGADVAVGSRYVKGGDLKNWPFLRVLISYGASWYVRLITWMPVKDPTAGFVCYKRAVLERIDLSKIRFVGYAFQIEMKFAAYTLGFKIRETPITFTDRVEGTSKMSRGIIKEAVVGVLKMRWFGWMHSYSKG